jgi:hypothetical protein
MSLIAAENIQKDYRTSWNLKYHIFALTFMPNLESLR